MLEFLLGDDGPLTTHVGIVKLHPTKRTHWVAYINQNYFDSYGCSPPQKLFRIFEKRNRQCFNFEYKIQGLYSQCAVYCL